jgi:hypothetical protein
MLWEDTMNGMNGKKSCPLIWVLAAIGVVGLGCAEEPTRPAKQANRRPGRVVQTAEWGDSAQGVQCRIRPIKRLWSAGEPAVFRVDFRNQGRRAFALLDNGQIHAERICLNGRWYSRPWLGEAGGKPRMLGPGDELDDLSFQVSAEMSLPLGPGLHTVQAAFLFEGVEVVSNLVDFEIASR